VHDLAVGKGFPFQKRRTLRLKGFDESVTAFEVTWQMQAQVDDGEPSAPADFQ
jgi:hypothetical protein